jgi:hypothetical protein
MTVRRLLQKTREYYVEHGVVRTVGSVALFCGAEVNDRCETIYQMRKEDSGEGHPLALRFRAARYGFSGHLYLLLGLADRSTECYLSSVAPIRDLNDGHIEPIHDKRTFQLLTEPYVSSLPTLYGMLDDGAFTSAPGTRGDDGLFELLGRVEKLVLKPRRGGQGSGIYVLEERDTRVLVNGEVTEQTMVAKLVSKLNGYVVTEFVEQHRYANAIFPDATNTIRVYSIIDPETERPSVLCAAHRFGSRESAPIDNWSSGGYCAPIDQETGEIKRLIVVGERSRSRQSCHPATGATVAGVQTPFWEAVRDLVCTVADLHRAAPLVGWDVVVSDDGPVVLEGNARPGVDLLQLERGALANPPVQRALDVNGCV